MYRVYSGTILGTASVEIVIEVDVRNGLPCFEMVGLPGAAMRESRERIRAAIRNSGFDFPLCRVVVNLAPAYMHKHSPALDFPIALGILAALGLVSQSHLDSILAIGELSLGGAVRPVHGSLSVARLAVKKQRSLLVPADNAAEAASVEAAQVYAVHSLKESTAFLRGQKPLTPMAPQTYQPMQPTANLQEIRGQNTAKRALMIAASGRHHILFVGPPGTGKSMLAERLPALLPPMRANEAIEATMIHSAEGLLEPGDGLLRRRPVRTPHHSITSAGLIGGGQRARPGEITLAHTGVLLLDELPEFSPPALQALREPLEHGRIHLSRAHMQLSFPACFVLIATANPCPCGYLGHPERPCTCTASELRRYQRRLTGPLLDRIEMSVFLQPVREEIAEQQEQPLALCDNQQHVSAIWPQGHDLAQVENRTAPALPTSSAGQAFLAHAARQLALSARGYQHTVDVASTIARLENAVEIQPEHAAEALSYRWEHIRTFWD